MRRRLAAAALALALAACSGGSDGADDEALARQAQLRLDDLPDGWHLTSERPGADGGGIDEFAICGDELELEDRTTALSEARTFTNRAAPAGRQQLVSATAVTDTKRDVTRFLDGLAEGDAATCLAEVFRLGASAAAAGDATITARGTDVEADAVAGAEHSLAIRTDLTIAVDGGAATPGQFDVVVLGTGRTLSFILVTAFAEPVPDSAVLGLAEALAERQDPGSGAPEG